MDPVSSLSLSLPLDERERTTFKFYLELIGMYQSSMDPKSTSSQKAEKVVLTIEKSTPAVKLQFMNGSIKVFIW